MAGETTAVGTPIDGSLPPPSPPSEMTERVSGVEHDQNRNLDEINAGNNADSPLTEEDDSGSDGREIRYTRSRHGLSRVDYAEANSDDTAFLEAINAHPEHPHVRTRVELNKPLHPNIIKLAVFFSFNRYRDIESNALLGKADAQWSHFFSRSLDPFLLGLRCGKDSGTIFDVDSWMNIAFRGNSSHYYLDNDLEGLCPSLDDIEAYFAHCYSNNKRRASGENPVSLFEVEGFYPGTIHTYDTVSFGRDGFVNWYATVNGHDLNFPRFRLRLQAENARPRRKQCSPASPNYTIPAMVCKLRRHDLKDPIFWARYNFEDDIEQRLRLMYVSAGRQGWFDVATEDELQDLVKHGVLESTTCAAARMFRGLDGSKTKPAFFGGESLSQATTTKKKKKAGLVAKPAKAAPALPSHTRTERPNATVPASDVVRPATPPQRKRAHQHGDPDTPPKPKNKKQRNEPAPVVEDESALLDSVLDHGDSKSGDYVTSTVTELPESAQELKSRRVIRPAFEVTELPDGTKQCTLPKEWLENQPKYSRAPLSYGFAQKNSLFPRKPVPEYTDDEQWSEDDDESSGLDDDDEGSGSDEEEDEEEDDSSESGSESCSGSDDDESP